MWAPFAAQRSGCKWERRSSEVSEPCRKRRGKDTQLATTRVKGHAENPYNNRCDELAVAQSQKYK